MGTAVADPAEGAGQAPATSTCESTKKIDECQSGLPPATTGRVSDWSPNLLSLGERSGKVRPSSSVIKTA